MGMFPCTILALDREEEVSELQIVENEDQKAKALERMKDNKNVYSIEVTTTVWVRE